MHVYLKDSKILGSKVNKKLKNIAETQTRTPIVHACRAVNPIAVARTPVI